MVMFERQKKTELDGDNRVNGMSVAGEHVFRDLKKIAHR